MASDSRKQDSVVSTEPGVQVASPENGRQKVLSNISRNIWGDDPRERRYVRKLDTFLFSYVLLGYFVKYLDQNNYSNAFVSGMQEELHLYGNERNLLTTYFNIGIILGTIPAQMIQLNILGSWYGKTQLAKRMALFEQTAAIAGIFSGYLQAGLYTGMNGTAGLSGWRWLFIMDGR
ncbi:hypothetical protein SGCOL_000299 [Colletotrichum sp. CLE4]